MTHTAAVPDQFDAFAELIEKGQTATEVAQRFGVEESVVLKRMKLARVAPLIARYALVIVFVWFAGLKFTAYEAQGIAPLGEHSPFLSWIYHLVSIDTFSQLLGVAELITAVLLALYPWSRRASASGLRD